MKRLREKVAIITGGASGIGKAVATLFAAEGAQVIVADYDGDQARSVVAELINNGGQAKAIKVDVSSEKEVLDMVDEVQRKFNSIDVLVNAAGILKLGNVLDLTLETWEQVLRVNLTGTFLCSKAVLPIMLKKRSGSIINFSSSAGASHATKNAVAYVTSKGGVTLLTKSMAVDHAEHNIRVNAVCPGPTDTPMLSMLSKEDLESLKQTIPMGRLGSQEEIAKTVLFLASDDSSFVTGALIEVDGGQTATI